MRFEPGPGMGGHWLKSRSRFPGSPKRSTRTCAHPALGSRRSSGGLPGDQLFHLPGRALARVIDVRGVGAAVTGATTAYRRRTPSRLPKKALSRAALGIVREKHPKPRLPMPVYVDLLRPTPAHQAPWPP
jgi:hypothetical protein